MSIVSLSLAMPPPPTPVDAVGDWGSVESAIGTNLPNDFKEFIGAYGSGTIGNFLTVYNPFSDRPELNLIDQSRRQLSALHSLREDLRRERVYDLYPCRGGILPVAVTDNGDIIHWITKGHPNHWAIVVNEARSPDYEQFECNITTFIERIIEGSVHCRALPKNIFLEDKNFRSF